METVNRKTIACKVATALGIPNATSELIINQFLDEVVAELCRGNRLEFRRFGVFQTRIRGARAYRPPSTGARIERGPRRVVKFTPSSVVERMVGSMEDAPSEALEASTTSGGATKNFLKWVRDREVTESETVQPAAEHLSEQTVGRQTAGA